MSILILFSVSLLYPSLKEYIFECNIHQSAFLREPNTFEGQKVGFSQSRIISINPGIVQEMGHNFRISNPEGLKLGEWVSLEGIWTKKGLKITRISRGSTEKKIYLSLPVLFVFLFLIFRSLKYELRRQ